MQERLNFITESETIGVSTGEFRAEKIIQIKVKTLKRMK